MKFPAVAMLNEFKPTIWFLGKFITFYIVGSIVYGLYITYYEPEADPVTHLVTVQSSWLLNLAGWDTLALNFSGEPTTYIQWKGRGIVSVYEGCNSLNVMIIFLSFMFSFGPYSKKLLWYSALSLGIIYMVNLMRIIFLFFVVLYIPDYTYYLHKYFFTAFIYLSVLALWIWWVRINEKQRA
ncbi:MAG: exosortase family protein XrtF [Cyclobacteriaceae bacterium]|nr:exosortase family protein XrtF [Cyclobacteriaceae bacterium]